MHFGESYDRLNDLFLVRMVERGDTTLDSYYARLDSDYRKRKEQFGAQASSVLVVSLRDDILGIPFDFAAKPVVGVVEFKNTATGVYWWGGGVGEMEPGDAALGADVFHRRDAGGLVQAADGDVDPVCVGVAEGQRRAAGAAETAFDDGR